jgi:hypothetical protein
VLIGKFEGAPTENGVKLGFRKAVFDKNKDGEISLHILEFAPDLFHLWKYNGINKKSFDGKIIVYDQNYKLLHGYVFEAGKIKGEILPAKQNTLQVNSDVKSDFSITTCTQTGGFRINSEGDWEAYIYLKCDTEYFFNHGSRVQDQQVESDSIDEYIGGGGGGDVISVEIPEPYLPGQDDPKVNAKKMMDCFESISSVNASYKLTIYVKEPIPGTLSNIGPINSVGHVAMGITKTGSNGSSITQVVGFYPSGNAFGSQGEIHNNGGMNYNVSLGYNLNANSFNIISNLIGNTPPYYYLINSNCASYVFSICSAGGLNVPSPYNSFNPTNLAILQASPANMGSNMRDFPNSSSSLSNRIAQSSNGECN